MNHKLILVPTFFLLIVIPILLVLHNDPVVAQQDDPDTPGPGQQPQACFIDMFEPNDSCGAASTPLGPGFFTPLYLCQGEDDWFSIEVPAGHTLEVETLFTHGPNSDLDLTLFADDCSTVVDISASTTDNELVSVQATADALYYARLKGYGAGDESSYEMQIDVSCEDCLTYQGQLKESGGPANGPFEFRFQLWDAKVGGLEVSAPITQVLPVTDGLLTTQLYFGDPALYASTRSLFLEIQVRPEGSPDPPTPLMPRQEISAAPVANGLRPGSIISDSVTSPVLTLANSGGIGLVIDQTGGTGVVIAQTGGDGIYIPNAGGDGIDATADGNGVYGRTTSNADYGGYFVNVGAATADGAGLYAAGNRDAAPDVTLGGATGTVAAISNSNADLSLQSNRNVTITLDSDHTTSYPWTALFTIIGNGQPGFIVEENGDTSISGRAYISKSLTVYGYIWANSSVVIAGDLSVAGSLSKGSGSFKIDHPLDPENQYLYHSFVESPDMMNVYNGNIELDENGEAWVELPDWFEALNRDFRYQLTPIGAPGPNLYIATPVADNRFQIAGGTPGMTVSWQVTGIRHDPYAEANRIQVEVPKPPELQGTYLHPEAWGQPPEMGEPHTAPALGDAQ